MTYPQNFIDLINNSNSSNPIENYFGTGNPSSNVIFFGKELGFNSEQDEQMQREVLNNQSDWLKNILNNTNFDSINDEYNPLLPYNAPIKKAGHTWSKYTKLSNYIFNNQGTFFKSVFISEIGLIPSITSKRQGITDYRYQLIKTSKFYQSFSIVVLACGDYLTKDKIEDIFGVKYDSCKSMPSKKLVIYRSKNKLVINTRQLSFNVSDDYLKSISNEIKQNL